MHEEIAVSRSEDERAAELERIAAEPMLSVPLAPRAGARRDVRAAEDLDESPAPKPGGAVGEAMLVDQERKREIRLVAKGRRVLLPPEPDRGEAGARPNDLRFPVAQPGDVLAAEDSAVVAQEREDDGTARPEGAQADGAAVDVRKDDRSERFRDGRRHATSVSWSGSRRVRRPVFPSRAPGAPERSPAFEPPRGVEPMRLGFRAAIEAAILAAFLTWSVSSPPPADAAAPRAPKATKTERATFAGGCFWCMETAFEGQPGVLSVTSGYSGGHVKNPTYHEVGAGGTGHAESVEVVFDPTRTSYANLLDIFWHSIDPTSANGQFCDRGNQYRSAIFYRDAEQKRLALETEKKAEAECRVRKPFATEIVPFAAFYPAEEYHQDYYKKNPENYHAYREGCGRDRRLRELWGDKAAIPKV